MTPITIHLHERQEVLLISALILAGQNAYRADSQGRNFPAIVQQAKDLLCALNECSDTPGSTSLSEPPPPTPSSTPDSAVPPLRAHSLPAVLRSTVV